MIWFVLYWAIAFIALGLFSILDKQKDPSAVVVFSVIWPITILLILGVVVGERMARKAAGG